VIFALAESNGPSFEVRRSSAQARIFKISDRAPLATCVPPRISRVARLAVERGQEVAHDVRVRVQRGKRVPVRRQPPAEGETGGVNTIESSLH
jgi:hypothetical protein